VGRKKEFRHLEHAREFEPVHASELIETRRAHIASLQNRASVTSRALHDCYEYETNESHLGKCIDVVRHLLDQVLTALPPPGIVTHDPDPLPGATEIAAGCDAQRQLLLGARHLTLATIQILKTAGLDPSDQNKKIMTSLRDLEEGIRTAFDATSPMQLAVPTVATT
jgi:hypothetical protein